MFFLCQAFFLCQMFFYKGADSVCCEISDERRNLVKAPGSVGVEPLMVYGDGSGQDEIKQNIDVAFVYAFNLLQKVFLGFLLQSVYNFLH